MSLTLTPKKSISDQKMPEVMDRLFTRLLAFYGSKFTDAYVGISMESIRTIWSEELSCYSLAEINLGVSACRTMKWPPTLPEFLSFCRAPILPDAAYHEAIQNMRSREDGGNPEYSHPAIYWATIEIGYWDMRNTPFKFISARWSSVLRKHLERGSWDEVPEPTKALPAPEGHAPSPEIALQLKELTASLKGPLKPALEKS